MSKTKVVMKLNNDFIHDTRVYKEALSLINAGFSVTVLCEKSPKTKSKEIISGIKVKRLKKKPSFLIPNTLKDTIKEKGDIYHAHDLGTLLFCYIAARKNKAKLVYDSHELYMDTEGMSEVPLLKKIYLKLLERFVSKRCNAVITVNESIAKELAKRYKIKKPYVVMNCALKEEVEKTDFLKGGLKLPLDQKIALYHGYFQEKRGIEKLIEAAEFLPEKIVIVFMGEGRLKNKMEDSIKELGVEKKVKFFPMVPVDKVVLYVSSADLGIIPYERTCLNHYYATPNKLFECLAAGVPIACSNFPEMKKIVWEFNIGEVFNPEDPREIASSINQVLGNGSRLEEIKANVKRAFEGKYNWGRQEKILLKVYRKLES